MFKVIDRTLTALKVEENDFSDEKLAEMCELIAALGVDYVEVSVPLLMKIGKLPEGGNYILKINSLEEKEKYPDFKMYTMDYSEGAEIQEDVLYEVKAASMQELMDREGFSFTKNIRLSGFDNMICEDGTEKVKLFMDEIKKKVDFCPEDKQYCATALALQWLMNGGRSISVSFNGVGGYAKLEEVLMGAKVIMHKKIKQDLSMLQKIGSTYEALTGKHLYYNKAVVGKNIFNLEAGIQVEKNADVPVTYEPYDPHTVGKVRRIVIGKNSGFSALKLKLMEKGIQVPEKILTPLLETVRNKSMGSGRSLTDREFFVLVQEVLADEA